MLRFILLLFSFIYACSIQAQESSNVYALIIGISDYEKGGINDLKFAHLDATAFSDYLQSESGGAVPSENIELLTNNEATIADIYIALKSIEKKVKNNGLVYFYFSGHGDVESSLYDLGFLLAADTPNKNYVNNAIRIEDINNMANTLSVQKNVRVVLITDACHAAKLSGSDHRGKYLVGEQLAKVQGNEVRIASCDTSQLSYEGKHWGDGRGAFSYYLVKGLMGLADRKTTNETANQDGQVTLAELKNYLSKEVATSVALEKRKKQTPIIKGKESTSMSVINQEELNIFLNRKSSKNAEKSTQILTPQNRYFKNLQADKNIIDFIDFSNWIEFTKDQIIDSTLSLFPCSYDSLLLESEWYTDIRTDDQLRNQFAQQFGAFLHNEVQQVINGYLNGAKAELEERQYYNAENRNFIQYFYMLQIAENLIDPDNFLHQIVRLKKYYFKGLNDRFSAAIKTNNKDSLIEEALTAQEKALNINPKAAYVINELGILNKQIGNDDKAIELYKEASALIPSWALPKSNLSNIYYIRGQFDIGLQYGKQAVLAQKDYYYGHINYGLCAQNLGNRLLAEESFLKAISINDKHFIAYEALAILYNSLTQYALSEYYFIEAEKRRNSTIDMSLLKERPILDLTDSDGDSVIKIMPYIDTTLISDADIIVMFCYAISAFRQQNYDVSIDFFERIVKLDNSNPLVYRYLAEIYFKLEDWARSIDYFMLARSNYLEDLDFEKHYQALIKKQKYITSDFATTYKDLQFENQELNYFIAQAAENMNHYQLAELEYEACISQDSSLFLPYLKLCKLYEKQEQYQDAENTIARIQPLYDEIFYQKELYAFYKRMLNKRVNPEYYHYKAGLMMYNISKSELKEHPPIRNSPCPRKDVTLSQQQLMEDNHYFLTEITPGTHVIDTLAKKFRNPTRLAIRHFTPIESELHGVKRAEVCYKLGILYNSDFVCEDQNSRKFFQIAMELNPDNESYKFQLLEKNQETYEFTDALVILDTMNSHNSLLYEHTLTYAKYLAQAGRFDDAFIAFNKAKKINIIQDSSAYSQETIAHLLHNNPQEALERYLTINQQYPDNADTNYSIARLYAYDGRQAKAYDYLKKALRLGFNHKYVLNNDYLFSNQHKTAKWNRLMKEYDLETN